MCTGTVICRCLLSVCQAEYNVTRIGCPRLTAIRPLECFVFSLVQQWATIFKFWREIQKNYNFPDRRAGRVGGGVCTAAVEHGEWLAVHETLRCWHTRYHRNRFEPKPKQDYPNLRFVKVTYPHKHTRLNLW